jgi:hypothetical protein
VHDHSTAVAVDGELADDELPARQNFTHNTIRTSRT